HCPPVHCALPPSPTRRSSDLHDRYLEAGADIVATNTFNATAISQTEYGLADLAYELNRAGACLARRAADRASARDESRPRWVAGDRKSTRLNSSHVKNSYAVF